MRTYGRIKKTDGSLKWIEIDSDANDNFEYGYATTLIQVLKLARGESPFFANYGIPAQRSVMQQVFPDFYVTLTQQQFTPFFASLQVSKLPSPMPTYDVNIVTTQGTKFQAQVAI